MKIVTLFSPTHRNFLQADNIIDWNILLYDLEWKYELTFNVLAV